MISVINHIRNIRVMRPKLDYSNVDADMKLDLDKIIDIEKNSHKISEPSQLQTKLIKFHSFKHFLYYVYSY